jgi:hypothetical protein
MKSLSRASVALLLATAGNAAMVTAPNSATAAVNVSTSTVCTASGDSTDQDPNGLKVRASPNAAAKVVGKLFSTPDPQSTGSETFGPRFAITDVKPGWVKINNAEPEAGNDDGPVKKNYTGAGWISAKKAKGNFYTEVHNQTIDSAWSGPYDPASDAAVEVLDPDGLENALRMKATFGSYPLVLACKGEWLQITYRQTGYLDAKKKWVAYSSTERKARPTVTAWLKSSVKDY